MPSKSPQAKGRIARLFATLQDRLVKKMRIAQITTLEQANRFLEITFWPFWEQGFNAANIGEKPDISTLR